MTRADFPDGFDLEAKGTLETLFVLEDEQYAPPYNVFESALKNQLFMTAECLKSEAYSNEVTVRLMVYAREDFRVYKNGHYFKNGKWHEFAFHAASFDENGEYMTSNGWIDLHFSLDELGGMAPFYFLAYPCGWINEQWACGCRTPSCKSSQWSIQRAVPMSLATTCNDNDYNIAYGAYVTRVQPAIDLLQFNYQKLRNEQNEDFQLSEAEARELHRKVATVLKETALVFDAYNWKRKSEEEMALALAGAVDLIGTVNGQTDYDGNLAPSLSELLIELTEVGFMAADVLQGDFESSIIYFAEQVNDAYYLGPKIKRYIKEHQNAKEFNARFYANRMMDHVKEETIRNCNDGSGIFAEIGLSTEAYLNCASKGELFWNMFNPEWEPSSQRVRQCLWGEYAEANAWRISVDNDILEELSGTYDRSINSAFVEAKGFSSAIQHSLDLDR